MLIRRSDVLDMFNLSAGFFTNLVLAPKRSANVWS